MKHVLYEDIKLLYLHFSPPLSAELGVNHIMIDVSRALCLSRQGGVVGGGSM